MYNISYVLVFGLYGIICKIECSLINSHVFSGYIVVAIWSGKSIKSKVSTFSIVSPRIIEI